MSNSVKDSIQFTEAYYRSRRTLTILCGLLIGYEWLGVELDNQPIDSVNFYLENPDVLPYALILLIIFSGFRFELEWRHNKKAYRRPFHSRFDYVCNFLLVLLAITSSVLSGYFDPDNSIEIKSQSTVLMIFEFLFIPLIIYFIYNEGILNKKVAILLGASSLGIAGIITAFLILT